MPSKQRMRIANEKMSKNVLNRGNVPKTLVRFFKTILMMLETTLRALQDQIGILGYHFKRVDIGN